MPDETPDADPTPQDGKTLLPPFVTVARLAEGNLNIQTNLPDKLAVLALLEGAKFALMLPDETRVHPAPANGSFLNRIRRH